MATIFAKIIEGKIPSYKIAESDQFYAFLDINPLKEGHTLIIPKIEVDYIFDLEDVLLGEYMVFSKKVATAIKKVINCKRIGMTVIGLEVPHAHIHLIPIDSVSDMNFGKKPLEINDKRMKQIATRIRSAFEEL